MGNLNIPELVISRADDISALESFECGIAPMDCFIKNKHSGLLQYIRSGLTNLWIVRMGTDVAAMFALSKSSLILNSDDQRVLSESGQSIVENIFDSRDSYPAIEIDYLAVDKKYQRQNLGAFIISSIIEQIKKDKLSATMFLTVEAYQSADYSAKSFYLKTGFRLSEYGIIKNLNIQRYGDKPMTVRMYRPLF